MVLEKNLRDTLHWVKYNLASNPKIKGKTITAQQLNEAYFKTIRDLFPNKTLDKPSLEQIAELIGKDFEIIPDKTMEAPDNGNLQQSAVDARPGASPPGSAQAERIILDDLRATTDDLAILEIISRLEFELPHADLKGNLIPEQKRGVIKILSGNELPVHHSTIENDLSCFQILLKGLNGNEIERKEAELAIKSNKPSAVLLKCARKWDIDNLRDLGLKRFQSEQNNPPLQKDLQGDKLLNLQQKETSTDPASQNPPKTDLEKTLTQGADPASATENLPKSVGQPESNARLKTQGHNPEPNPADIPKVTGLEQPLPGNSKATGTQNEIAPDLILRNSQSAGKKRTFHPSNNWGGVPNNISQNPLKTDIALEPISLPSSTSAEITDEPSLPNEPSSQEESVRVVNLNVLSGLIGESEIVNRLRFELPFADDRGYLPSGTDEVLENLQKAGIPTNPHDMINDLILFRTVLNYFCGDEKKRVAARKLLETKKPSADLLGLILGKGADSWEKLGINLSQFTPVNQITMPAAAKRGEISHEVKNVGLDTPPVEKKDELPDNAPDLPGHIEHTVPASDSNAEADLQTPNISQNPLKTDSLEIYTYEGLQRKFSKKMAEEIRVIYKFLPEDLNLSFKHRNRKEACKALEAASLPHSKGTPNNIVSRLIVAGITRRSQLDLELETFTSADLESVIAILNAQILQLQSQVAVLKEKRKKCF